MRLSPKRLFFPLLVSFSLTGAGLILIYFLNKKKEHVIKKKEEDSKSAKLGAYKKEIEVSSRSIPAIIGRCGKEIERIKQTTKTEIFFKEEIDYSSENRTCVISGPHPDNVKQALDEINKILSTKSDIETYEIWAPVRTINNLSKHNHKLANEIQNESFAKLIFDKVLPTGNLDAPRKVTLKGKAEHIACAVTILEKQIQLDREEEQKNLNGTLNRAPRIKPPKCVSPESEISVEHENNIFDHIEEISYEPALGKPYEVFISSVESPSRFYVQVIGEKNAKLDGLIKDMTIYYGNEENLMYHILKQIEPGQVVAAKFTDGKWYRGQVIDEADNQSYNVFFFDFGDVGKIKIDDVMELSTDFLSLRWQAQETLLYGVKPKDGEWSQQAIDMFSKLSGDGQWEPRTAVNRAWKERAEGDKLPGKFGAKEGIPIPVIELFERRDEQFVSINKELIRLELAAAEDHAWSRASSTQSLSRRSADSPSRSMETSPNGYGQTAIVSNGRTLNSSNGNLEFLAEEQKRTPEKQKVIEEIDLRTPVGDSNNDSVIFIENERTTPSSWNGITYKDNRRKPHNPFKKENKRPVNIMPAGYEDERSDESDGFEMN